MPTRTYGKLHFTDLDPGKFEMLAMLIIFRMRRWERLDHYGAAGSDAGVDIRAVELLENGKRNVHHFQCKRYEKLTKGQLKKIVLDYKEANIELADYYYIVCGCNPSKTAIDGFDEACKEAGIKNYSIWSASYLETLLFSDYHDILFAYFGINLTSKRNDTVSSIRRNLALKKKMHSDFTKQNVSDMDLRAIRYKAEYWRKFINAEILIRSIYDMNYPGNSFEMPGYFKAEVYDWYHNGLEVRAYPFAINARLKDEGAEVRLEVFGCIPFENIIAYDLEGDEYYNYPHLFCDYPCGADPYEEIRYRREGGYIIDKDDIIEVL